MRVIILEIIVFFILMCEARAQIELKFGQFDTRVPDKSFLDNENLNLELDSGLNDASSNTTDGAAFQSRHYTPFKMRLPFHDAALNGNINDLKRFIESEMDVNLIDKDKQIPLHYAAESGDFDCVEFLIDNVNSSYSIY